MQGLALGNGAKHIKQYQTHNSSGVHFNLTSDLKQGACGHVQEELQYYHDIHIAFIDLDRFEWRTVASPSSMVSLGVRRPNKKPWDHGWPWFQSNSIPWWLHGKCILSILQNWMLLSRSPKLYGFGWNVMLTVYVNRKFTMFERLAT